MFENISGLLKRYNFQPTEKMQRDAVVAAVHKATGITLKANQVRVQGKILYLTATPACRQELALSQVAILEELRRSPLTEHIALVR